MIVPCSWPPGDSERMDLGEDTSVARYQYPGLTQAVVIVGPDGQVVMLGKSQFMTLLQYARIMHLDREEGWE